MRGLLLVIAFLGALVFPADAATRFWVGGTGPWDGTTTTHWAASSGGAGGQTVPTSSDTVTFDTNSGTGTVTLTSAASVCSSLTTTSSVSAITIGSGGASQTIKPSLGVTLSTAATIGSTTSLQFQGTGTFTSAGKTLSSVSAGAAASVTQADNLVVTNALTVSGTWTVNGHNLTARNISGAGGGTFDFGTGTTTATGNDTSAGGTTFDMSAASTFTASSATIEFTDTTSNTASFNGLNIAVGTLYFHRTTSTGKNAILNGFSTTIGTIKDDGTAAHTLQFPNGLTMTLTTWSVSGNSGALISLRSDSAGNQFTLSASSGPFNPDFLNIQDSAATGGATWNAGSHSVNNGNNSGWIFSSAAAVCTRMLLGVGPC